ncbi:MAG TPA: helix-hairpin-helix domain-containing protein, partial [Gemmataceae bacterium]|nr:helix-hairpin-helix domain-containing protein [Gemmataceae bacterium]
LAPVPASATPAVLWPRSAQLTLAFLLGVSTALLLVYTLGASPWATRPAVVQSGSPLAYPVDLNRADEAELLQIPGVGPSMAQRIEDYRRTHGPFRDVDDLQRVGRVGPATLRRVGPWVRVAQDQPRGSEQLANGEAAHAVDQDSGTAPSQASRASKKGANLKAPVDINRASVAQLQQVPWIGPTTANRIIAERQKQPFRSVDDLRRVKGIGPKKLAHMRPYLMVGSSSLRVVASDGRNEND